MRLFVLLLTGCAGTASASTAPPSASASSFAWVTPEGWRSETIPFPLEFAPSLPYRGTEEIRFAPRFFAADAPMYFTYSFAWVVEGAPAFEPPRLATELETYFAGLARAVAPARFDAHAHHASVARQPGPGQGYEGTVDTVDAFGDGRALHLRLAGEVLRCAGDRSALVLSLSPRTDEATWSMLAAQRRTLRCR